VPDEPVFPLAPTHTGGGTFEAALQSLQMLPQL
jgi:hypothetical protein